MRSWTPAGFGKHLERRTKKLKKEARGAAYEVALRGLAEGVTVANRLGIVDRGTYVARFRAVRTREGAELRNDAPHSRVVEFGRRPGSRPPPIAVILSWIRRKGIDVSGLANVRRGKKRKKRGKGFTKGRRQGVRRAQAQLAFLIARAIGRRGLKAHRVFQGYINPKLRQWWRAKIREIVAAQG